MSVKFVALLKRRPDLSPEQFRRYYEEKHVPLENALLSNVKEYRRNYIQPEGMFIGTGATEPDFDVITELTFPDQAAADAAMATMADPDVARRVAEDEKQFLDRPKTRMFVVQTAD